jgi:hypothetical protein
MATPHVLAALNESWQEIQGTAASVEGVTWQNIGPGTALIAFTASAPISTTAYNVLKPGDAFYDKSGSSKVWARAVGGGSAAMTAVSD